MLSWGKLTQATAEHKKAEETEVFLKEKNNPEDIEDSE